MRSVNQERMGKEEREKKRFCCVEQHVEGHDGRKEAGQICFHDKQQSQEGRSGSARVRDMEEKRGLVFTSEKHSLTISPHFKQHRLTGDRFVCLKCRESTHQLRVLFI